MGVEGSVVSIRGMGCRVIDMVLVYSYIKEYESV